MCGVVCAYVRAVLRGGVGPQRARVRGLPAGAPPHHAAGPPHPARPALRPLPGHLLLGLEGPLLPHTRRPLTHPTATAARASAARPTAIIVIVVAKTCAGRAAADQAPDAACRAPAPPGLLRQTARLGGRAQGPGLFLPDKPAPAPFLSSDLRLEPATDKDSTTPSLPGARVKCAVHAVCVCMRVRCVCVRRVGSLLTRNGRAAVESATWEKKEDEMCAKEEEQRLERFLKSSASTEVEGAVRPIFFACAGLVDSQSSAWAVLDVAARLADKMRQPRAAAAAVVSLTSSGVRRWQPCPGPWPARAPPSPSTPPPPRLLRTSVTTTTSSSSRATTTTTKRWGGKKKKKRRLTESGGSGGCCGPGTWRRERRAGSCCTGCRRAIGRASPSMASRVAASSSPASYLNGTSTTLLDCHLINSGSCQRRQRGLLCVRHNSTGSITVTAARWSSTAAAATCAAAEALIMPAVVGMVGVELLLCMLFSKCEW